MDAFQTSLLLRWITDISRSKKHTADLHYPSLHLYHWEIADGLFPWQMLKLLFAAKSWICQTMPWIFELQWKHTSELKSGPGASFDDNLATIKTRAWRVYRDEVMCAKISQTSPSGRVYNDDRYAPILWPPQQRGCNGSYVVLQPAAYCTTHCGWQGAEVKLLWMPLGPVMTTAAIIRKDTAFRAHSYYSPHLTRMKASLQIWFRLFNNNVFNDVGPVPNPSGVSQPL